MDINRIRSINGFNSLGQICESYIYKKCKFVPSVLFVQYITIYGIEEI